MSPLRHHSTPSPRRSGAWALVLRTAALAVALVLGVVALRNLKSLKRHGQNAFSSAYYGLDPLIMGRSDADFPSPACCEGGACVPAGRQQRVALVTLLSSPDYLPLLRQLECTLRRSNPGVEIVVVARPDAAGAAVRHALQRLNVTLLDAPELEYHNTYEPRHGGLFFLFLGGGRGGEGARFAGQSAEGCKGVVPVRRPPAITAPAPAPSQLTLPSLVTSGTAKTGSSWQCGTWRSTMRCCLWTPTRRWWVT